MHTHTHTYTHKYICIHACTHTPTHAHTQTYIHTRTYKHKRIYTHTHSHTHTTHTHTPHTQLTHTHTQTIFFRNFCKLADVIFLRHTCNRVDYSIDTSIWDIEFPVSSWSRLTRRVATTVYTIIEEKSRKEMR